MRLKLDENLPIDAGLAATAQGHDVDTVRDEALGGASDEEVLAASIRENRFLVNLDRGFGDIRRYPPGEHPGIVVLRVDVQDSRTVTEALGSFLANERLAT